MDTVSLDVVRQHHDPRSCSPAFTAHNGLFRIDPRVQGNKLVDSQFKQYAGKTQFTSAVTTAAGQIAVAGSKGDIKLFDSIGKNAKVCRSSSAA